MLTIVYLKNEILLSSSSNGGKAIGLLQIDRTRGDRSMMLDAKPNIPMETYCRNKLKRPVSWPWKALSSP